MLAHTMTIAGLERALPISEVCAQTGFGKTKSQTILKRLAASGYVRIVGNGRGTKYTATAPIDNETE